MKRNSAELKVKYHGNKNKPTRKKNPNPTISEQGYRDDSPYRSMPYIDIHTPSGRIDMSGTGIPLWANGRILQPYSGVHQFDTETVREIPLARKGGWLDELPKAQTGIRRNIYDSPTRVTFPVTGGWDFNLMRNSEEQPGGSRFAVTGYERSGFGKNLAPFVDLGVGVSDAPTSYRYKTYDSDVNQYESELPTGAGLFGTVGLRPSFAVGKTSINKKTGKEKYNPSFYIEPSVYADINAGRVLPSDQASYAAATNPGENPYTTMVEPNQRVLDQPWYAQVRPGAGLDFSKTGRLGRLDTKATIGATYDQYGLGLKSSFLMDDYDGPVPASVRFNLGYQPGEKGRGLYGGPEVMIPIGQGWNKTKRKKIQPENTQRTLRHKQGGWVDELPMHQTAPGQVNEYLYPERDPNALQNLKDKWVWNREKKQLVKDYRTGALNEDAVEWEGYKIPLFKDQSVRRITPPDYNFIGDQLPMPSGVMKTGGPLPMYLPKAQKGLNKNEPLTKEDLVKMFKNKTLTDDVVPTIFDYNNDVRWKYFKRDKDYKVQVPTLIKNDLYYFPTSKQYFTQSGIDYLQHRINSTNVNIIASTHNPFPAQQVRSTYDRWKSIPFENYIKHDYYDDKKGWTSGDIKHWALDDPSYDEMEDFEKPNRMFNPKKGMYSARLFYPEIEDYGKNKPGMNELPFMNNEGYKSVKSVTGQDNPKYFYRDSKIFMTQEEKDIWDREKELKKANDIIKKRKQEALTPKKTGGSQWLDKYQKKGNVRYVGDPNDPALKAYQDSSSLYNASKKAFEISVNRELDEQTERWKEFQASSATPEDKARLSKPKRSDYWTYEEAKKSQRRVEGSDFSKAKLKREKSDFDGSTSTYLYVNPIDYYDYGAWVDYDDPGSTLAVYARNFNNPIKPTHMVWGEGLQDILYKEPVLKVKYDPSRAPISPMPMKGFETPEIQPAQLDPNTRVYQDMPFRVNEIYDNPKDQYSRTYEIKNEKGKWIMTSKAHHDQVKKLWLENNKKAYGGSLPMHQTRGQVLSTADSVNVMGQKHIDLEHLIGYPGGQPNTSASMTGDKGLNEVIKYVKNQGYGSAMNQGQISSWLYNAGFDFDKGTQTINPKRYILGEYYRAETPYKKEEWDENWGWAKRNTLADAEVDKLYNELISTAPEEKQQLYVNRAKDWFYKNRAGSTPHYGVNPDGSRIRDEYGAWSPDYAKVWAPFIKNQFEFGKLGNTPVLTKEQEIDYNTYYRNQTVPKGQRKIGGSLPMYQVPPSQVSGRPNITNAAQSFVANNTPSRTPTNSLNTGFQTATSDTTRATIGNIKGQAPKDASVSVRKDFVEPVFGALSYAKYLPLPGAAAVGVAADVASLGLTAFDVYKDVSSGNTGYGTVANASKIAGKVLKGSTNPIASGVGTALNYFNKGNAAVKAGSKLSQGDLLGAAISAGKVLKRTGGWLEQYQTKGEMITAPADATYVRRPLILPMNEASQSSTASQPFSTAFEKMYWASPMFRNRLTNMHEGTEFGGIENSSIASQIFSDRIKNLQTRTSDSPESFSHTLTENDEGYDPHQVALYGGYDPSAPYIYISNPEAKQLNTTPQDIFYHEKGHLRDLTSYEGSEFLSRNKSLTPSLQNELNMPDESLYHNISPEENYSDLNALRNYMFENKIYDASKGNLTIDVLNKALKDPKIKNSFSIKRLLKNFSPKDIVELNNKIAGVGNPAALDIAKTGGPINKFQAPTKTKSNQVSDVYDTRTDNQGNLYVIKINPSTGIGKIIRDPSFVIPGQNQSLGDMQSARNFRSFTQGQLNRANTQAGTSDQVARTAAASMPQGTPQQQVRRTQEVQAAKQKAQAENTVYVGGKKIVVEDRNPYGGTGYIGETPEWNPNMQTFTAGNPLAYDQFKNTMTVAGAATAGYVAPQFALTGAQSLLTALSMPATVGGVTYTGATLGNLIGSGFMANAIMDAPETAEIVTDPNVGVLEKADAVAGVVAPFLGMGLFSGNKYLDPLVKYKLEKNLFSLGKTSGAALSSNTDPRLTAESIWEGGTRFALPRQTESVLKWGRTPETKRVIGTTSNLDDQGRTILEGKTVTPPNPNPENYRVITDETEALDWYKKSNEFDKLKFNWLEGQGLGPLDGFANPGASGATDDMLNEFKLLYGHLDPGNAYIPMGTVSKSKWNEQYPFFKIEKENKYFNPEDYMNLRGVEAFDKRATLSNFMTNLRNEHERLPSTVQQYLDFKNLKFKTSLNDPRNLRDPRTYLMEFRRSNYASDKIKNMKVEDFQNMDFDDALNEALKMKEKQINFFDDIVKKEGDKPLDKGFFDINPNRRGGSIKSKNWADKYK